MGFAVDILTLGLTKKVFLDMFALHNFSIHLKLMLIARRFAHILCLHKIRYLSFGNGSRVGILLLPHCYGCLLHSLEYF